MLHPPTVQIFSCHGRQKMHTHLMMDGYTFKGSNSVALNPIALRKAKIAYSFGLSECNRVKKRFCCYTCKSHFFFKTSFGIGLVAKMQAGSYRSCFPLKLAE